MPALRDTAARWVAASEPAVLVRVAQAQGSVPREAGTRMLVSATTFEGSIGGGHLEWRAIDLARRLLAGGGVLPHEEHVPLGPALGQCCGGAVTLAYERLDAAALAAWPQRPALFHLQLYGAGHVGRAIVRALAPLPVRVDWIDEREGEFPTDTECPPQVHKVCVDEVQAEVALAPAGAMFLVLTHQHDLDLRITEAIARRADFAYLGLIGSATKRARFFRRLVERGVPPEVVERITCPIGVPGIAGKEPEVIAAAVVAQLLQVAKA
jgi:xanthine dehydrogenase accessory factor